MTAVHIDGGLRAVLSGAVLGARLRRWENQRMLSTLCLKNVPPLTCYNLYVHGSIATIFRKNVAEKAGNRNILSFPTSPN